MVFVCYSACIVKHVKDCAKVIFRPIQAHDKHVLVGVSAVDPGILQTINIFQNVMKRFPALKIFFLVSIADRERRNLFKPIENRYLTFSANRQLIHEPVFNFEPHAYCKSFYKRSIKIKDKQQLITVVAVKKTTAGFTCKGCLIYPAIIVGTEMFF